MNNQLTLDAGFNHLENKVIELAKKSFEEVLEAGFKEHFAYFGLGCCYHLSNQSGEAIEYFEKSIQAHPNAASYFNMGVIYMDISPSKAEECYRNAIKISPNEYNSHVNLGLLLERTDRLTEAKDCYEKAIKINPESGDAYFNLAHIFADIGKPVEAEECYRKLLYLNPGNTKVYSELGLLFASQGFEDKAEECYNKAIKSDTNNFIAYSNYGLLLIRKGFLKDAEHYCSRALEIDPNNSEAYEALGLLKEKKKLHNEAEECYKKAIELNSSCYFANQMLGDLALKKGQLEEAEVYLKKAIELNPRNPEPYITLGTALSRKGATTSAEECYNEAIKLNPMHSVAYSNLGHLYLTAKKLTNEAEAFFNKAIETNKENALPYWGLGDIALLKSGLKKSFEYYSYAINLDSNLKELLGQLFKYPVELNPDKEKHFYRFIYLSFLDNHFTQVSVALKYAENIDAAMLINRIVTEIGITQWDSVASFYDSIRRSIDKTYSFRLLIQVWKTENKYPYKNLLSTAIINYYTGDPIEAYRIFDYEIEGNDMELDLFGQYYFCLSATSFMEEERAVLSAALTQAKAATESITISTTEKYYAALIFYLNGRYEESIGILEEIFPEFMPAGYKLIEIFEAVHKNSAGEAIKSENGDGLKSEKAKQILREIRLKENSKPLYQFGIEAIAPSHEGDKFLEDIMPVIHFMEVQDVVAEVFVKPMDIRSPFFNLIVLDESDIKKERLSLKDKAAKAWQQVIEQEIDLEELEDGMNYKNFKHPHLRLAELIHLGASTELSDIKEKHRDPVQFNFKLYLLLNYRLNKDGYIGDEDSIRLNDYIYVCMDALPVFRESTAKTYFLSCVRDYFLQDRIPYLAQVQQIHQLIKLIRKDKIGKTSPILRFEDFSIFHNSVAKS